MEDINFLEHKYEDKDSKLDELVDLITYKVKKFIKREDGTQIATKIAHFSHEHGLKFANEAQNNQKCNGCAQDILPPFYSCVKCNFFLHESCAKLPKKKNDTCFIDTHSPSSQNHLIGLRHLRVIHVVGVAMVLSILVRHAYLNLIFNIV